MRPDWFSALATLVRYDIAALGTRSATQRGGSSSTVSSSRMSTNASSSRTQVDIMSTILEPDTRHGSPRHQKRDTAWWAGTGGKYRRSGCLTSPRVRAHTGRAARHAGTTSSAHRGELIYNITLISAYTPPSVQVSPPLLASVSRNTLLGREGGRRRVVIMWGHNDAAPQPCTRND